jgi:hypothetical protein
MHMTPTPTFKVPLTWSPYLATAIEFETGATLRALINVHDHLDGAATWRVSRRAEEASVVVGQGSAESLDLAAGEASAFIFAWQDDGAVRGVTPVGEL